MGQVLALVASIAIIVVTVFLVNLLRGALPEIRKLGQAGEDLSHLARTIETELPPTIEEIRSTLNSVNGLASQLTDTAQRVDRAAACVESVLDVANMQNAASRAVRSSTAGLLSVYEGVKQGIKTLRGSKV